MAIPDYQSIMLPLLQYASDGKEHSIHETVDALAAKFGLSQEERNQHYPNREKSIFADRVEWARTYMKQAALLEAPRRTYFRITKRGLDLLAQEPARIGVKQLQQFSEFQDFQRRSRASVGTRQRKENLVNGLTGGDSHTPKEAIELNYQRLQEALAQELLATIRRQSPSFFEGLVVRLLVAMGYGGSIRDAGQAIGRTGDEGIDGIIKEDKLGLDIIYIQAKRWDRTVGRPEIQQFAGALAGQRARKGVFITTSSFTSDARNYVAGIDSKIVLIGGEELAQLMIDHNVGVAVDTVYELKRVDSDYFSGD